MLPNVSSPWSQGWGTMAPAERAATMVGVFCCALASKGMVHAWVDQKLVKTNIFFSFIQCPKVEIESLF
jgi:hypothetical protein